MNKNWGISIISALTLALVATGCSQLNAPYQGGETIAVMQAAFGAPAENEGHSARPALIGHRGSGLPYWSEDGGKPPFKDPIGNTARAIEEGIRANVDWIEIDLRRTASVSGDLKEGELVLFHDKEVDARTSGTGPVSGLTAMKLQEFDIHVNPPEKILTLDEFEKKFVADLVDKKVGLILDVKESGLKEDVLSWLEKVRPKGLGPENVIIFGEHEILKEYLSCGYRLGYTLTWGGKGNPSRFLFQRAEIVERLKSIDADILVVPVIFTNRRLIQEAADEGIETWSYASEDKRDWDESVALGVTGLIVDYPKHAVRYFDLKTEGDSVTE